ncbi:MAG: hypothetical protein GF353_19920 [Candidatus Lokiarchaeota archaeon]|nr:hypothetical protein [Candidatus Lokiarchaeota archaeon]
MIELLEHHKAIYIQGDKNPKRVKNLEAFLLNIQKRAQKRGFIIQIEPIFIGSVEHIIKIAKKF